MIELTPSVADVVEFQLPENVRSQENELFVKFIKYYYDWLMQEGQPTEVIHNLLSYRDIDLASTEFRKYLTSTLLKFVPASSNADQNILQKHLSEFLRSKGTYESFEFIMRAVYGEEIEMKWNSDNLFRPSSNEYSHTATCAVESTLAWTDVEGSTIVQYDPTPASATIESCTTTTVNGKNINWLTLNDKTVVGTFIPEGSVKALKNTINRNWYFEEYYFTPKSFSNNKLVFQAVKEEYRSYENLIVKQINSSFRAEIVSFVSRIPSTGSSTITVDVENVTGTFVLNQELYIFAAAVENEISISTDYEYGIVSPSVGNVVVLDKGSLYVPGDTISFIGGNGINVNAHVAEVTPGVVTEVNIIKKGYGYAVGDALIVDNEDSGGIGFSAEVSTIDGVGANIEIISELNTLEIIDGGYDYEVGDVVEILDGTRVDGTIPIKLTVSTVDSGWAFLGVQINSYGFNYPRYSKVALIDTATTEKIAGFGATITFNASNVIPYSISITATPTISTNALVVVLNGYGATADAVISGNTITGTTITNDGVNYIDPVIEVIGDGAGAVLIPVVTAGKITSITISDGGNSYTVATLIIRERNGSGSSIVPLIRNQTDSLGSITGLTLTDRGNYVALPNCFNTQPTTKTGVGGGARLNLSFKAKSASVENSGQFYYDVTTIISGKGTGAILKAYQTGGVVDKVYVVNGGINYYYGTTVTIPGGTLQCDLSPVIVNGVITDVTIIDGGTGYTPYELEGLVISSGTEVDLSTTIAGTGKIVNYDVINGGSGYKSQAEITPLSISLSGGTGAKFLPSLSDSGNIIKVDVLDGGAGYSISDTFTVTGGGGSLAALKPVVFNGRITDVVVENGGIEYSYGTYAIIVGDGINAAITPIVETGITEVNIVDGGTSYNASTSTIVVTDTAGTGAEIKPTITDGKIVALEIINKGTGYLNPQLSVGTPGSGINATLTATAQRFISSLEVTNAGSGYTYADILLVGDGENADFTLAVEKLGAIETVTVDVVGNGYTATPIVTVTDVSGYGAVSGVKITNNGGGYRKLPVLTLADKYALDVLTASGTKFTCFGEDIGGIRHVAFDNHGADYQDLPKTVFGMTAILIENAAFKEGEKVTIQNGVYREEITSSNILFENDDVLITEEEDYLLLDLEDVASDVGVYATVRSFDFDRNMISLNGLSDTFIIIDEGDNEIVTELGLNIVDQSSGSFDVGDVIIGAKSRSRATIGRLNRAVGSSVTGGNGYTSFSYLNDVGMLNSSASVIPDNNKYQDRAYVLQCGRSINDYMKTLKQTVHPAGYAMFGDVKTQAFLESNLLNEIGYNKFVALLIIYSIVLDGFESESSTMDELFGEFTKFNFTHPIELVEDYAINESSLFSFDIVQQYYVGPLYVDDLTTWTTGNYAQVTESTREHPSGAGYMKRVLDSYQLGRSWVRKDISSTIGNNYAVEMFIGKQVGATTFPRIQIGDNFINLDTNTGEYYASAPVDLNVSDVGDYWWIRISAVAISSTTSVYIYPSQGYLNSGLSDQSASATGSISVSNIYIRNVTGLSTYSSILRGINSHYIPAMFRFLATEASTDWPSALLESGDLLLMEDLSNVGLEY